MDYEAELDQALRLKNYTDAALIATKSREHGIEEAQMYATLALAQAVRANGGRGL